MPQRQISVFDVERQDEFGELSRAFFQLSRQRRDAEDAAAALARIDPLTGIGNRRMFEEALALTLKRASRVGTWTGIAYLDIDFFKKINDSLGHGAGDAVLIEFALRLTRAVRATDTVARLAGDEFVILFECIANDGCANSLGQNVADNLAAPFDIGGVAYDVSASMGIAVCAPGAASPQALLHGADSALYEAKRGGRNCFAIKEIIAEAV